LATRVLRLLAPLWVVALAGLAPAADFERWEKEIQTIERRDKEHAPPRGAILFAGSSSIRMWNVAQSFPGLEVVNHGFGGSQIADSVHFAPRLILPLQPRILVFYAGDNDLAAGKKPDQVLSDFQTLVRVLHKDLPKTRILFVAIKPCPSRWSLFPAQTRANALIKDYCQRDNRLLFLDVVSPMLGADGKPRPELFAKDQLHLNDKGYELWTGLLRPHLK